MVVLPDVQELWGKGPISWRFLIGKASALLLFRSLFQALTSDRSATSACLLSSIKKSICSVIKHNREQHRPKIFHASRLTAVLHIMMSASMSLLWCHFCLMAYIILSLSSGLATLVLFPPYTTSLICIIYPGLQPMVEIWINNVPQVPFRLKNM